MFNYVNLFGRYKIYFDICGDENCKYKKRKPYSDFLFLYSVRLILFTPTIN